MAKIAAGSFALLLVDGYNLLASLTESVTMGKESITQQTNAFGASSEEHTPVGLERGTLTAGGGFFDQVTDAVHAVIGSISHVSRIICAGIEGNTIGKHFWGFEGVYDQKYEVMDKRDELTKANVTYLVAGAVEEGVIVQNLAAITATVTPPTGDTPVDYISDIDNRQIDITSATKANPCVVTSAKVHGLTSGQKIVISGNTLSGPSINTTVTVTVISTTTFSVGVNTSASTGAGTGGTFLRADSVGGWSAYVQATAYSGFTGVLMKIMHSPDDTTYAVLVTFTNLTAIGKERKTGTSTVDRYLSSNPVVTGSGSITAFTGLVRK